MKRGFGAGAVSPLTAALIQLIKQSFYSSVGPEKPLYQCLVFLEIASTSPNSDLRRQDSILRNAHLKAPLRIIHTQYLSFISFFHPHLPRSSFSKASCWPRHPSCYLPYLSRAKSESSYVVDLSIYLPTFAFFSDQPSSSFILAAHAGWEFRAEMFWGNMIALERHGSWERGLFLNASLQELRMVLLHCMLRPFCCIH